MKKVLLVILWFPLLINAQNSEVLYDFNNLPQTLLLNPGAEVFNKSHIGFPFLSNVKINAGFTGFSTYDIFADNGININSKIKKAINKYGKSEFITANQQVSLLNGGLRLKNNDYLSFGIYEEFDALLKIPRDVVDLFYDGNSEIGRHYSIKNLNGRAELLGVFHIGISKKLNKKWQVGGRFKIYSSAVNIHSSGNNGAMFLENGTNNIYRQNLQNINFLMQSSGVFYDDSSVVTASYLTKKLLLGGNLGIGFDAGFTYHPQKHITITGSILDAGFITYKKNVESYRLRGSYQIEGIQLFFDPLNPQNYWQDLKNDFDNQVVLDTLNAKYTTLRPVKLYGSYSYSFGRPYYDDCHFYKEEAAYTDKFGFQLFSTVGAVHSYFSGTLFYEKRINKHLQTKLTYTIDPFSVYNVGLGISTRYGPFNLFLAADNLVNLVNIYDAKNATIQFGINFIFNGKK